MKIGQCFMQPEHTPPGFWHGPGDQPVLVDGVEFESGVATRFFQSVDAYPSEWGRLRWRIQLNKIVSGRAGSPVFRTFYPGIEWNLHHPDYRWFLSAWFQWEGPGPQYREPALPGPARIEKDTVLFRIADFDRPVFLRSRVDVRDRRRIAEALQSQPELPAKPDSAVIVLDDIFEGSE